MWSFSLCLATCLASEISTATTVNPITGVRCGPDVPDKLSQPNLRIGLPGPRCVFHSCEIDHRSVSRDSSPERNNLL